jgi:hypothetical protein
LSHQVPAIELVPLDKISVNMHMKALLRHMRAPLALKDVNGSVLPYQRHRLPAMISV